MPLTIRYHCDLPPEHSNWTEKPGLTQNNLHIFEAPMGPSERKALIKTIVLRSLFSLGIYFLYLKFSKSGREDLANLANRKIVHLVKELPPAVKTTADVGVQFLSKPLPAEEIKPPIKKQTLEGEIVMVQRSPIAWDRRNQSPADTEPVQAFVMKGLDPKLYGVKISAESSENTIAILISKNEQESEVFLDTKDLGARFGLHPQWIKHKANEEDFTNWLQDCSPEYRQAPILEDLEEPKASLCFKGDIRTLQREEISIPGKGKIEADKEPIECFVLQGVNGSTLGLKVVPATCLQGITLQINDNGTQKSLFVDKVDLIRRWDLKNPEDLSLHIDRTKRFLEARSIYHELVKKHASLGLESPLPEDTLYKIAMLSASNKALYPLGADSTHISITDHKVTQELSKGVQGFNLVGFKNDKLYLATHKAIETISRGNLASIERVSSLSSKKPLVIKIFRSRDPMLAIEEAYLIETLHANSPFKHKNKSRVPGIQKPTYGVVQIQEVDTAILQEEYGGDLTKALGYNAKEKEWEKGILVELNDKLSALYPLLVGLNYCVTKKGLFHHDLKPHNILYQVNPNTKKLNLYLSDFGSASFLSREKIIPPESSSGYTSEYIFKSEWSKLDLALDNLKLSPSITQWKKFVANCYQSDIFALGCTLIELLIPEKEYFDYDSEKHPKKHSFKKEALKQANIPGELIELVEKMVHDEPSKRPSITEVLTTFENILKSRNLPLDIWG